METIISNVYLYLDRINTIFDNLLHELLSLSSILREKKKRGKNEEERFSFLRKLMTWGRLYSKYNVRDCI